MVLTGIDDWMACGASDSGIVAVKQLLDITNLNVFSVSVKLMLAGHPNRVTC